MKKSIVKEYFETSADHWIANSYKGDGYNYPTALHRVRIVRRILAECGESLSVADLGCGGGNLAIALAIDGHDVVGIDQSARMVEIARQEAAKLSPEVAARLRFSTGEIEANGLAAGTFDAVTCMGVIGYQPDDSVIFRAAANVLKPGGRLLVSCRNRLFNMASPSFRTENEVIDGRALELLRQLRSYYQPIPDEDKRRLIERVQALPALLADHMAAAEPSPPSATDDRPGIESRQHTPKGLEAEAVRHGFRCVGCYGVHPHLIDPNAKRLLPPGVFNALSSVLEVLEHLPIAIAWSSVFVSVFRKI
jgi:2-polyprenyl-3-methyl-5-hydroxy-6-metoxy-1,4-benzoquinol methylase